MGSVPWAVRWQLCAYDTIWQATDPRAAQDLGLPKELSVLNNDGRVAVFVGPRPGYNSEARARAADLIAHVPDTDGSLPLDFSAHREFVMRLEPALEQRVSATPGALPLLLAICAEGFWAQGAICHGGIDFSDDASHGGAVDEAALLRSQARGDSTIVRSRKTILRGYERHLRTRAKKTAKEQVAISGTLAAPRAPLTPREPGSRV